MTFNGRKLKELRQLFQMSSSDVAEMLQVDFHKASHFERGIETPDFNQIQILCREFHVKPMYFFTDSLLGEGIDPTALSINHHA